MSNFDSLTTRMPNGVTNAAPWQTMGASGIPDPTWAHVYENDFDRFSATEWTTTLVGTGTQALTPYDGGALLLTTTAGATDSIAMQLINASFQLKPGKAAFFKFAGVLSDVVASTLEVGLLATTATPLTAANGIAIIKKAASSALFLRTTIAGVTVDTPFPAVCAPVNNVAFELGIEVDYLGNIAGFFNPTTGSNPISAAAGTNNVAPAQPRGRVASLLQSTANGSTPVVPTAVLLAPTIFLQNGAAAAKTLTVDFITAVRER